jgi:hypothetical protein
MHKQREELGAVFNALVREGLESRHSKADPRRQQDWNPDLLLETETLTQPADPSEHPADR